MKTSNQIALPIRYNKVRVTNMKTGEVKDGSVIDWSAGGNFKKTGFIRMIYVQFKADDNIMLHCAPNLVYYSNSDCFPSMSPFFAHINHVTAKTTQYKVELLTKKLTANNYLDTNLIKLDNKKDLSTKSINKTQSTKESEMKNTKRSTSKKAVSSKADAARAIFKKMFGKKNIARKDIIAAFMKEAKLSKAGASTYYQNIASAQ